MDFLFRISVTKQIDNSVQWSVLLSTVEKLLSYYKKIIVTNYFSMLAKGGCNKTVFSLGSVGSADSAVPRFRGSVVPRSAVLQILPIARISGRSPVQEFFR